MIDIFFNIHCLAVFEMMAFAGSYGSMKDWILIMPGGTQCKDHDMPDMPQALKGFGMTSNQGRFIYLCGGFQGGDNNGPMTCEKIIKFYLF